MIIDKYISIRAIVERVYGDTGYQFEIPHDDLILWTVECMDLIGYPLQYVPKIMGYKNDASYEFTDYRIALPCDFHKLQAVAVNGYPAYAKNNSMHHLLDGGCCGLDGLTSSQEDVFITEADLFSPSAGPYTTGNNSTTTVSFDINNNYITFNASSGKACIAYWAFPIDEQGFPIIPDDSKYKRAVQNYLIYKVDYRLWRQGFIEEKVFRESENQWLWAVGSVTSHLKMPSLDQMEVLKNSLINLIPKFNSYQTFFQDLATKNNRL